MIGCLRTRVRKQPIIAPYFESETVLKFYNLEARNDTCAMWLSEVAVEHSEATEHATYAQPDL